jgi:hypothetical protein
VLWGIVRVFLVFWLLGFAGAVMVHVANLVASRRS